MESLINKTENFVKKFLVNAESGHNWWHAKRVRDNALYIAKRESQTCDIEIVELASLLHDIADSKFHNGDEYKGVKIAKDFLSKNNLQKNKIDHILEIISKISFHNSLDSDFQLNKEGKIVQDADRLDAIGAIGIARTFNYGGFKSREIYDPEIKPIINISKDQYTKSTAPTINHFYEKLLLIKDLMNTKTGMKLAEERHSFMLKFLKQFYAEWEINNT